MNALEITNLKKIYDGKFEALKGISLNVKQGDFYALLGPNGAGKSTAIGIICSLVNKTSGSVRIFGHDLDTDKEAAKSSIGLVPQEFNFNQFEKVLQIIINQAGYYGIPRPEARKRAKIYLEALGLWDKRHEQARSLSGGMKRRLMIVRALIHRPKLLILDEPTAGVDIELRRSMWTFLEKINKKEGTTIILTTHYLEEAEMLCDSIGIIRHGELIENTSMKTLLARMEKETFLLDIAPMDSFPKLPDLPLRQVDTNTIEVEVTQKLTLNHIFDVFNQNNIQVISMRNKSNRLEELFVDLINKGEKE